ncbi:MAG: hypothetical protein ACOYT4_04350 [Nanoarchaeota archaeon]
MNKKATPEITLGKLVTIIMVIIVVVLVAWGSSEGIFNPVKEKISVFFDEVQYLLGGKPGTTIQQEFNIEILGQKRNVVMNKEEKTCEVDLDNLGLFRLNFKKEGRLERSNKILSINKFLDFSTPLYFRFNEKWEWSFEGNYWMSCFEFKRKEMQDGTRIIPAKNLHSSKIKLVESIQSKNFEDGRKILEDNDVRLSWEIVEDLNAQDKEIKQKLDEICR